MPFNAYIAILCEKLHTDPKTLLDHTLPQLQWITDGIIYNNQSEEDKKRNNTKNEISKLTQEEQKRINDFIHSK